MLRTGASRLALRTVPAPAVRAVPSFRIATPATQWNTQFSSVASKRPQVSQLTRLKPVQAAVLRRALSEERKQAEARYAKEEIKPTPERVTMTSTIHPFNDEVGGEPPHQEVDMSAGIKQDLNTIRETFNLSEVPRQAYYIGLAGVLPYLATSVSTVACAYEINHAVAGYGYLMSARTATDLLHILEPLQVGYGAVILSFLGAIHWGLEFAGYGGHHGYNRYAIGVVASAVAWPTVLMPVEYALISQFMAFTLLYYVDTRATYRGWTPPWYAIYRFVLTFIVGGSIVVSLIGRGEVADEVGKMPGAVERMKALGGSDAQETMAREEEGIRAQQELAGDNKKGDDDSEDSE
ncbi:hypothetical protein BU23DRAFT_452433 [Bimuria novae-zelandiae CBS 107.79]|uniref:Uncharacterized protein n=1 Tax=Bimuria novae-zelandiae CBS 107.79 TaxID=1447943 RepID=A0A6A5VJF2_9PLEO|nr:hypothetical protein BU23DRAFT_452433 [Bimuria novae-zelandiae CBS 107.79]